MAERKPHIVGIGNALVDVLAEVGMDVVTRHALTHGGMHLVEADAASALFDEVGPGVRQSGGSVANSIAHVAEMGAEATYLGKVADDALGRHFRDEMAGLGVNAPVQPAPAGEVGTGRCVVLVTPEGQRTMSTHLGAAVTLKPSDIEGLLPERFDMLLIEGYLWDAPMGAAVIETVAARAREAGAKIALTPSDPGCVERHRDVIQAVIGRHIDVLIGNELEIRALAERDDDEAAFERIAHMAGIAVMTHGPGGVWIAQGAEGRWRVPADPVSRVVDTTGAGDAFAAGMLAGLVHGDGPEAAARRGTARAAEVLQHFGARNGPVAQAISLPAA